MHGQNHIKSVLYVLKQSAQQTSCLFKHFYCSNWCTLS